MVMQDPGVRLDDVSKLTNIIEAVALLDRYFRREANARLEGIELKFGNHYEASKAKRALLFDAGPGTVIHGPNSKFELSILGVEVTVEL